MPSQPTTDRRINAARRRLLQGTAAGLAGWALTSRWPGGVLAAAPPRFRIGSCAIGLEQAKQAGLDGVEIRVGNAAEKLEIADPQVRAKYKLQMKETGLVISSFMMGLLNSYPLASDPRGPAWLEQSIDAAKDLEARTILVAFFGKGSLLDDDRRLKKDDRDAAIRRVQAAAPRAKDSGVVLALENTLSAQQNLEMLDRIGHDAVRIYYDVGNSARMGYDVPAEIRRLKDRIAIFHFKDNPHYLGEGDIRFPEIAAAIHEIGYRGWIVMETNNPSKDAVADARRNAAFIRKLLSMPAS